MEYENQNFENENDELNNYNFEEDNNQYDDYNIYERDNYNDNENGEEGEFLNENENNIYILNEENIKLKEKCELLFNSLNQKNNEIKELQIKYNKDKNKYINLIKNLKNESDSITQKYFDVLKEIKLKNRIITDIQNGVNINDINFENNDIENFEIDENFIQSINDKIQNIRKDIFEEINPKNSKNNLQMVEKSKQIENLINNLDKLAEELHAYKNKNMETIINLRSTIDSQSNNANIKDQFYLNIIDLIKNLSNSLPENEDNLGKFPSFSLNDEDAIRHKNIFNIIKILTDYIIFSNKNQKKNNYMNEELSKRIKEMSELLVKSNENLSKSRKDYIEVKKKYEQLEMKYNSMIDKNKDKNINNEFINKDKNIENLKEELNKKNQQIKSLEHMITRLSNNKENNEENNIKGEIINKKSSSNLYFKDNKFVKNEKIEKNLQIFLDKFTKGEYGSSYKNKNNNINNLKEEVDRLSIRINKELEKNFK